jgi:hypothetical protein
VSADNDNKGNSIPRNIPHSVSISITCSGFIRPVLKSCCKQIHSVDPDKSVIVVNDMKCMMQKAIYKIRPDSVRTVFIKYIRRQFF